MKEKMMRWLMGLLSVALIAGNLTYVSAGVPDVDAADSQTGSAFGADMSVSGNDVSVPGETALETEHGASVLENDTFEAKSDASIPENDEPTPETDTSVSGNDALVPESNPAITENDASVSGNDAGESPMLLNSDAPWALGNIEITFSRQYQALMLNSFGQYYCVDFDE